MIKTLLMRYKLAFFIATVASALSAFAGIATFSLMSNQITSLSGGEAAFGTWYYFMLGVLGVAFFGVLSRYILAKVGASIVHDLQNIMVRRLLLTPYEKIEKIGGDKVMATLGTDILTFSDGLILIPVFIYSVTTVVLSLSYMFYVSWPLALLVSAVVAIIVLTSQLCTRWGVRYMTKLREYSDSFFSSVKTLVDGGKELNSNRNRKMYFYSTMVKPLFGDIKKNTVKVSVIFISLGYGNYFLIFSLIGFIIYGSSAFPEVSIGAIVAFSFIIFHMLEAIADLIGSIEKAGSFFVAYKKVESLHLSEDGEFLVSKAEASDTFDDWKRLTLKNIRYSYPKGDGNNFSAGPFDVSFEKGKTYFCTGKNGSGKSTFIKLLIGLYSPNSGTVFLDDKQVGVDIPQDLYKAKFSTIFSDFFLFDFALNKQGELADDNVVDALIDKLELSGKVSAKKGVLSSTSLSQGQRKRLALLLSYIEDAQVCVYDEWAADQDPFFRKYFYTVLIPELKSQGKTLILITHDDQYFHLADHRIDFDKGGMVMTHNDKSDTSKLIGSRQPISIEGAVLEDS